MQLRNNLTAILNTKIEVRESAPPATRPSAPSGGAICGLVPEHPGVTGDPGDVPAGGAIPKERKKSLNQRCVRPLGLPSVREATTDVGAVSQDDAGGRGGVAPPAPSAPRH